jgi:hypothetical protein
MCDNDSPFKKIASYTLTIEPFLNTYSKQYQNIIMIDKMPEGPLSHLISHFNPPKLSPFRVNFDDNNYNCCKYAIRRHYNTTGNKDNLYLTVDDIPSVLAYLSTNGYIIDTQITKLIQKTNYNKKLICVFTYSSI